MQRIGRYWERSRRFMLAESGKVWNYHSWNVVFFQNVHAPHPYNLPDWQVVDPTPQVSFILSSLHSTLVYYLILYNLTNLFNNICFHNCELC